MTTSNNTPVYIIYNPNSTGDGKALAKHLADELKKFKSKQSINIVPTKKKGDGERLAYKYATDEPKAMIISSSGDGGYHEVVNGIMRANSEGSNAIVGLLPGGNANDHYVHMHKPDIANRIINGSATPFDLIKVEAIVRGKPWQRYAHSYVGFGLTPHVGKELNKTDIKWYNQPLIVLRGLFTHRSVPLTINGKRHHYESAICSNIASMSKVLTIDADASSRDGKMEVSLVRRRSKMRLIGHLLWSSVRSMPNVESTRKFECQTNEPTLVQLDGELTTLDANSGVTISVVPKALKCIV